MTAAALGVEAIRFVTSSVRSGLACWYGSIREPAVLIPYVLLVGVGLWALLGLRPAKEGRVLRRLGVSILVVSWLLLLLRQYYAGPRLMGYGMMLVLLGMAPRHARSWRWPAFAVGTALLAIYNAAAVDRLGVNHPAYERAAEGARAYLRGGRRAQSNAPSIFRVHLGAPVLAVEEPPPEGLYLEVTLPNYDAISTPVASVQQRGARWKELARWEGVVLYRADAAEGSSD
jgi:hypothetical protein